jgi:hypothetical protein
MYINTGYEITNTPNQFTAAYNTWPEAAPRGGRARGPRAGPGRTTRPC